MKPNAKHYNPSPDYLRSLVDSSGLSQRQCAKLLGVNDRTMRAWLAGKFPPPYAAQFALEALSDPLRGWLEKAWPYLSENRKIPDQLFWELETILKD